MNRRTIGDIKLDNALARTVAVAVVGAMLLSGIVLAPRSAIAQSTILPRANLVEQLGARYSETQAAVGVANTGGVIEVFTTSDGSTWTLVLTKPDGTSQVIAAGETWIKRQYDRQIP